MIENDGLYSIGAVERDTGIGRDTLRVWERRYGFPEPVRREKGERKYSEKQLRQLQRIRRLLDQGMRPGKLLPLGEEGLDELEGSLQSGQPLQLEQTVSELIEAIHSTDVELLESLLQKLNTVGEFWARGKLQIFQEHFLSQQLIRFLNTEIARLQRHARKPRVLLATLPGEEHTLGLLMVAAMLSSHGVVTINIGAGVPMDQIGRAVEQFNVDIVGITFSGAYQYRNIRPHLIELRELIPDDIEIWTGGEGVRRLRKLPVGVTKFSTLEKLPL
jgi:DNA-binding transcriptional MerR regulator